MNLQDKVQILSKKATTYWERRVCAELAYAYSLSKINGGLNEGLIKNAADMLLEQIETEGAVTNSLAKNAETVLLPLGEAAKKYRVHCVSHAHIDMNWMWGFHETVAVTVDTFRTMLDLLAEYPEFKFSQSQASTYKIIEEYYPEMLREIRKYVHEGRWEIAASTWVEADKNMPCGESMCRHILYTKKYLSKLFDVSPDSIRIDFEPDTFGHNISVPEVLSKGTVDYYYHCRGNDGTSIYRWKARSGRKVLVYCDPKWYNDTITEGNFTQAPAFCDKYKTGVMLNVYGVGDHGGGPTRRDIERIRDYCSWPVFPEIKFSTYAEFFAELRAYSDNFPELEGEQNFIFTGCYTSQSRIKAANRLSELRLKDAEMLCAAARMFGEPDRKADFEKAWVKTLFNQFHDILTGSGVIETREYAMGRFQEALAAANTYASSAMRTIAANIDTSEIEVGSEEAESISVGAGVGYNVGYNDSYGLPKAERTGTKNRIYNFFNRTQYDYDGVAEIVVWDWDCDIKRALVKAWDGNATQCKVLKEKESYWGHHYSKLAVKIKVPAFGYSTYVLNEAPSVYSPLLIKNEPRRDYITNDPMVLENDKIIARFCGRTAQLIELIDKEEGRRVIDAPSAFFRFIIESPVYGMTSWRVGPYMSVQNLNETRNVRISNVDRGGIVKGFKYELSFGERSTLSVGVSLKDGSGLIEFEVSADFHETGSKEKGVPQLCFTAPLAYEAVSYRYDIPFGTVDRKSLDMDVPANSFMCALPQQGCAALLVTDTKYGYRGCGNAVSVNLIRGSYDPDPYPEYGIHKIRIGFGIIKSAENNECFKASQEFCIPPEALCVKKNKSGVLPLSGSFMKLSGAKLESIKNAENTNGLIFRLSDIKGEGGEYGISFKKPPKRAFLCDINEKRLEELPVEETGVKGDIAPFAVSTIEICF